MLVLFVCGVFLAFGFLFFLLLLFAFLFLFLFFTRHLKGRGLQADETVLFCAVYRDAFLIKAGQASAKDGTVCALPLVPRETGVCQSRHTGSQDKEDLGMKGHMS